MRVSINRYILTVAMDFLRVAIVHDVCLPKYLVIYDSLLNSKLLFTFGAQINNYSPSFPCE